MCGLLCVPSFLKFWCGGDRLRLGTRDTFKSFAVSVSFCSICVARSCEIDQRVVRKDGSVFLCPAYRFIFTCVVPFQMVMTIRFLGFMVGANATMFRFVLELCSSSLHSTCDANIIVWNRHICTVSKRARQFQGFVSSHVQIMFAMMRQASSLHGVPHVGLVFCGLFASGALPCR